MTIGIVSCQLSFFLRSRPCNRAARYTISSFNNSTVPTYLETNELLWPAFSKI